MYTSMEKRKEGEIYIKVVIKHANRKLPSERMVVVGERGGE